MGKKHKKHKSLVKAFRQQVTQTRAEKNAFAHAQDMQGVVASFIGLSAMLSGDVKETVEDMAVALCTASTHKVRTGQTQTDIEMHVDTAESLAGALYKNIDDKHRLKTLQQLFLDEAMAHTGKADMTPVSEKKQGHRYAAQRFANLYQKFHHKLVLMKKAG